MLSVIIVSMRKAIFESIKNSSSFYNKVENTFLGKRPITNDNVWEKHMMDKLSKEVNLKQLETDQQLEKIKNQLLLHEEILKSSKSSFLDDSSKVAAIVGVCTTTFFGYQSWVNSLELDIIKIEKEKKEQEWMLEKQLLKKQVDEGKSKIASLTTANLRAHDAEHSLTFKKQLSNASMACSLNSDLERILSENNGLPIQGNCSLYIKKR